MIETAMAFGASFTLARGDFDEAAERWERVLALREQMGDEEMAALARSALAFVMLLQGQTWDALRRLEETVRFWRDRTFPGALAVAVRSLAAAFAATGATGPAVRIYSTAELYRTAQGAGFAGPFLELQERVFGLVRRAADDPTYRDERAAGEAMSVDEAAAYALAVVERLREGRDTRRPSDD